MSADIIGKFSAGDHVCVKYDYCIGNMVFYKGTCSWVEGYKKGMVELKIGGIGWLIPEEYLESSKEFIKKTP